MIASFCLLVVPALAPEPLLQEPAAPSAQAAPAKAGPFSYTYAQIDIVRGDGDGYSDGPDGIDLHGSYGLKNNNLFLFGGLGLMSGDVGNTNLDTNEFEIGIGYHMPLSPAADLVLGGSLLYANTDSGGPGGSADGAGLGLQAGVRFNATPQWEIDGGLGWTDYTDTSSNLSIEVGAVFHATANLGICGALTTSDDIDTLSIGLRYQP